MALLAFCALASADAGRIGESGSGALWIAPELVASASTALPCSQSASLKARELVFETIEPGELDSEDARQLMMASREVVSFEWNPAKGELSYNTSASSEVFSDLAPSAPASVQNGLNCVSR